MVPTNPSLSKPKRAGYVGRTERKNKLLFFSLLLMYRTPNEEAFLGTNILGMLHGEARQE